MIPMSKCTGIVAELRAAIKAAGRRGLSRYAISKKSGVSQGMLSQFVNGRGELRLSTAEKIAGSIGRKLELTKCR